MKRTIALITLIILIVTCFCGCNMSLGLGNFEFNKIHICTYNYSGCLDVEKWYDNSNGIEVRTEDYGTLYLAEGTYILVEDDCPICQEKENENMG